MDRSNFTAETLVPQLSTSLLLGHPDNERLASMMSSDAPVDASLEGRRVAVVTTDGVEEIELVATLKFLRDRGASVDVVSPPMPKLPPALGVEMPARRETHILSIRYINVGGWFAIDRLIGDADADDYDAVIIPGGTWNPDALRADPLVLSFVQSMAAADKLVAAICHGPWVLVDAELLGGRDATCWWSMKRDIENAGATFHDQAVVVDGRLVTSRFPGDLPDFLEAVKEVLTAP